MFLLCILFPLSYSYKILQISDIHLDVDYSMDPEKNVNNSCSASFDRNKTLGSYGDFACDSPEVRNALDLVADSGVMVCTSFPSLVSRRIWVGAS